jgi:hypothetical protein
MAHAAVFPVHAVVQPLLTGPVLWLVVTVRERPRNIDRLAIRPVDEILDRLYGPGALHQLVQLSVSFLLVLERVSRL